MKTNVTLFLLPLAGFILLSARQVMAQCPADLLQGQNLVKNGDFSSGTDHWDFTRDSDGLPNTGPDGYILFNPPVTQNYSQPGFINVGSNPKLFNTAFGAFTDHTGGGNMLMVDGVCQNGIKLWYQEDIPISTTPTSYYFSLWIHALKDNNNPPGTLEFKIEINGTTYTPTPGAITAPTALSSGWIQYEAVWNSPGGFPPNTTATISIENTTTTGCASFVDFAVDDITFIPGCKYADAATAVSPDLGPDRTICGTGGAPIVLDVTDDGINDVNSNQIWWSDGVGDGTGGAGPGEFIRNIIPTPAQLPLTISVCTKVGSGCVKTDVITISGDYQVSIPDINLCSPPSATLDAGFSGVDVSYQWYKESNGVPGWQPADTLPYGRGQTFNANTPGTYRIVVNDPSCGTREDEVVITSSAPTPVNAIFCPDQNVTLSVTPVNSGKYKWWNHPTSTAAANLVQKGGNTYTFSATNESDYIFYVEDTAAFETTMAPAYSSTVFTNPENSGITGINFYAEQANIEIKGLTVMPFVYSHPSMVSVTFDLIDLDNGNTVIGTYTTSSVPSLGMQNAAPFTQTYDLTFPTPIKIPAIGNYRLVASAGNQMPQFDGASWGGYNIPGTIKVTGNNATDPAKTNKYPGFFSWIISAGTKCDRVPVKAIYQCPPCSKPSDITFTPATNPQVLCEGASLTVNADFTALPSEEGGFYYTWYKAGAPLGPAVTGSAAPALTLSNLTAADAATYTLRIEDGNAGNVSCYLEKELVVEIPATDPGKISSSHAICLGDPAQTLISSTDASGGSGVLNYQWEEFNGTTWVNVTSGGTTPSYDPGVITTTTQFRRAVSWGVCPKVYTTPVTVTVNPLPVADAGADDAFCFGGTGVKLNASGGGIFSWAPSTGLSADNISDPTAAPTATTTYTLTVTDANGCSDDDEVTITVNSLPIADAGADEEFCTGTGGVTLNASGAGSGGTYSWSPASGLSTDNVNNPLANPLVTTTYTLTVTDINGCQDEDEITVSVYETPVANAGQDASICEGGSGITLNATGAASGGTYSWTPAAGLSADNVANPLAAPASTTTYTVTVTNPGNCTDTDEVIVTVNPLPVISAGNDVRVCEAESTGLSATGAGMGGSYQWSPSDGLNAVNVFDPTATPAATTTYTVTGIDINGCENSDEVVVTVDPLPTATISGTNQICDNGSQQASVNIHFTGTPPYNFTYQGSISGTVNVSAHPGNSFTFNTSTAETYTITALEDGNGCIATSLTGQAEISYFPNPQLVDYELICDPANPVNGGPGVYKYYIRVELSGGDADTYQETTGTPGTFSGNIWTSSMIDENTVSNLSFTDVNGCNPIAIPNLQKTCSCPESADIAVSGPAQICEVGSPDFSELTVTLNPGGNTVPDWRFKIVDEQGNVVQGHDYTSNAYSGAPTIVISNVGIGKYFVTDVNGTCDGLGDGPVEVTYHTSPTAEITGDPVICDNGTDQAAININFTGTPEFSFTYDGTNSAPVNASTSGNTFIFTTMSAETFSLTSVTDGNGCMAKAEDMLGSATVSYHPEPSLVNYELKCDPANPAGGAPGSYNYYIEVELSGGNHATYQELTGVSGSWNGNLWTSGMIDENTVTSLSFGDDNNCNTIPVNNLQKICSCPESADIKVTGPSNICVAGNPVSSQLTITLNDGGNSVDDWRFKVVDELGNVIQGHDYTIIPYTGGNSLSIDNVLAGSYYVTGLFGTCEGSGDGPATINNYPSPKAEISGGETICDDGTTTTTITIDVSSGTGPFIAGYEVDHSGTTIWIPAGVSPLTYDTRLFGTHTLVSVTDANGCTALPADMTKSAVVSPKYPPTTPIVNVSPSGIICQGESDLDYAISTVPDADSYEWSVASGTGIAIRNPTTGPAVTSVKVDIALDATDGVIQVVARNSCGISDPALLIPVDVTDQLTPSISISADKTTICEGETVHFTSAYSSETTSPQFQWYRDGEVVTPNGTTGILDLNDLQNNEKITLSMISDYACPTSNSVTSNEVVITVNEIKDVKVTIKPDDFGEVCEGSQLTFTATANYTDPGDTYSWTATNATPSSITGLSNSFTATVNANSTVSVTLNTNVLCPLNPTVSDQVAVPVTPNEAVVVTLSTAGPVCEGKPGQTFTASAVTGVKGSEKYTWELNDVVQPLPANATQFTLPSTLTAGSYKVEVSMTTDKQCVLNQTDTRQEIYVVNPNPNAEISGPNFYCEGTTTAIAASPAGADFQYTWRKQDDPGFAATVNPLSIGPGLGGVYFVTVKNTVTGCDSTSKVHNIQEFNVNPVIGSTMSSDYIKCEDDSIDLYVNPAGTLVQWTLTRNGSTIPAGSGPSIYAKIPGIYTATVTVNAGGGISCAKSADREVTDVPRPAPDINEISEVICEGEIYPLTLIDHNYPIISGVVTWYKNGESLGTHLGMEYQVTTSGYYYVTEDIGKCQANSDSVYIVVEKYPVANAGPDQYIVLGEEINLSGYLSLNAVNYNWWSEQYDENQIILLSADGANIAVHPDSSRTKFYLTVSSAMAGCEDTDSMIVYVEKRPKPWNSFSPNGDGIYDTWIIEYLEDFPDALVEVYNRWGNLVWISKGYNDPWKGTNFRNNQELPVATYYYIIYPNGGKVDEPLTGHVTIVK